MRARQIDALRRGIGALREQLAEEAVSVHGGQEAGLRWVQRENLKTEDREIVNRTAVVLVACDPAPYCPPTPTRTAMCANLVG